MLILERHNYRIKCKTSSDCCSGFLCNIFFSICIYCRRTVNKLHCNFARWVPANVKLLPVVSGKRIR